MKLLALDIDDTLVCTGKLPSERLRRAVQRVQESGVTVVLATGRGFLGTKKIRESLSASRGCDHGVRDRRFLRDPCADL